MANGIEDVNGTTIFVPSTDVVALGKKVNWLYPLADMANYRLKAIEFALRNIGDMSRTDSILETADKFLNYICGKVVIDEDENNSISKELFEKVCASEKSLHEDLAEGRKQISEFTSFLNKTLGANIHRAKDTLEFAKKYIESTLEKKDA